MEVRSALKVVSQVVKKPAGNWSKPHNFLLELSGRSLVIDKQLWRAVPKSTLDNFLALEKEVSRLLSLKGIINSKNVDLSNIGPDADRTEKVVRTRVDLKSVRESLLGSKLGIRVLEIFEELDRRLHNVERQDFEKTDNGGWFSDITEKEAICTLKDILSENFTKTLDEQIPGPKLTIEK